MCCMCMRAMDRARKGYTFRFELDILQMASYAVIRGGTSIVIQAVLCSMASSGMHALPCGHWKGELLLMSLSRNVSLN